MGGTPESYVSLGTVREAKKHYSLKERDLTVVVRKSL